MPNQLEKVQGKIEDGTVGIRLVMPLINEWLREHPHLKLPAADWILRSHHPAAGLFRSKLRITLESEPRQVELPQEELPQIMLLRPSFRLKIDLGSIYCRVMNRDLVYIGYEGEYLEPLLVAFSDGSEQPVKMTGRFRRFEIGSWQPVKHTMIVWTGSDENKKLVLDQYIRQSITQTVSATLEEYRKENEEEFQLAAYIAVNNRIVRMWERKDEIIRTMDKLRYRMEAIRSGS
jgi:hypothetical protein